MHLNHPFLPTFEGEMEVFRQTDVTCHENEKYPQNIVPNIETLFIFA
jgi:hypothetical protein